MKGRHLVGLTLFSLLAAGCSISPPLNLDRVVEGPKTKELARVPFHPQEAHHCGPASLLTLLEASGVEIDYSTVKERVYVPGLEGSLQAEMSATTRHFGRIAYALPPEPKAVFAEVAAGRPVLVLLNLGLPSRPYWHYAVIAGYDAKRNRVILRSGSERRRLTGARRWLRQWDWAGRWALVALRPEDWPASPDRQRLLQALADFESTSKPSDARRAWQTALAHWPRERTAWLGLGNSAHSVSDWSAAEAAYREALSLDPDYWPARLNLASVLEKTGNPCGGLEVIAQRQPTPHSLLVPANELEMSLRAACQESGHSP